MGREKHFTFFTHNGVPVTEILRGFDLPRWIKFCKYLDLRISEAVILDALSRESERCPGPSAEPGFGPWIAATAATVSAMCGHIYSVHTTRQSLKALTDSGLIEGLHQKYSGLPAIPIAYRVNFALVSERLEKASKAAHDGRKVIDIKEFRRRRV